MRNPKSFALLVFSALCMHPIAGAVETTLKTEIKADHESALPPKIEGDDFPGKPCHIVFDEKISRQLKMLEASLYGKGTKKDPLRTYLKTYYHGQGSSLKFDASRLGSAEEFKKTTDLKSPYGRAVAFSMGVFATGLMDYKESLAMLHAESEHRGQGCFKSEADFVGLVKSAGPEFTKVAKSEVCAFRIDTRDGRFLMVVVRALFLDTPGGQYWCDAYKWDENRWKHYSMTRELHGTSPVYFGEYFGRVLKGQLQAPEITYIGN